MRLKEIRVYPIKSIRGVSVQEYEATAMGFEYDRSFMLQRVSDGKNMHVPDFPSMCLFTTELHPAVRPTTIRVRFAKPHTFDQPERALPKDEAVLEVPLKPDVINLEQAQISMHHSDSSAYVMPANMSKWFTDRFGFEVRFLHIGLNKRQVLGNVTPNAPRLYAGDPDPYKRGLPSATASSGWLSSITGGMSSVVGTLSSYAFGSDAYAGVDEGITFADCAPYLIINHKSYLDVQSRVDADIDIEKFRPNLVIEDTNEGWEEDYWSEIAFGKDTEDGPRMAFTGNCARCASLNVDYETGKPGTGGMGKVLASLQRDRRVDPGNKYSPIFGRYGFLSSKGGRKPTDKVIFRVGDEVTVTKKNERRTHLYWPGVGIYKQN